MFSRDHELGIGESEVCVLDIGERKFVQTRVMARDALERGGKAEATVLDEVFSLFLVLLEVGADG